jgi:hypothetical protein
MVTTAPAGISCTSTAGTTSGTCSAGFADGASVTLTANPTAGTFAGWSGACSGTGACVVSMTQAHGVTATFNLVPTHLLTVMAAGTGAGTVTSTPAGVVCTITAGSTGGSCGAPFEEGSTVTLAATASAGSFTGWSGACSGTGSCQVQLNQATDVTARFDLPDHLLTVAGAGTGSGTVTSTPAGIACATAGGVTTGNCAHEFVQGTTVTLTAMAASGTFAGWSGACSGTAACVVPMSQATAVEARFELPIHRLLVAGAGSGSGTIGSTPAGISCTVTVSTTSGNCDGQFVEGTMVTLEATATSGLFEQWGGSCSGTGSCQVTLTAPLGVTASFVGNAQLIDLSVGVLMGTGSMSAALRAALDGAGNHDGSFDVGDLVALIDRTPGASLTPGVLHALRRGEAP